MGEWPMVKLGEVARVVAGGTPKTSVLEYWDGDIPWVTPKDLALSESLWINAGERFITDYGLAKSAAALLPRGTVLWSSRAPIGLVAIANNQIATNQGFKSFVPGGELDSEYLAYFLIHQRPILEMMGVGATFKEVSAKRAAEIMVPLPPLGEQKRIAEILGRVAEAEQHVQDTLELLDEVAKSSFYTFCGIPDHFERRKKIGEIAIVATGNTPPRKDPSNYGSYIEWIKSDNLGSIFPTPASEFLSEEGLKRGRVAAPGSLLMTCIAGSIKSIGKCSVVNRKVAFNQQINSIKPVNNEDLYYLYLLFYVAPYLVQRRSTGGLKGIVKKSSLEMCEIPWPERKVRQMIGTFCQEWINCHLLVMRKLSLLQELQKSLATRAFAGLL
ncbi:restriction endonuclease subunit S [Corynebacterium matruchotii]|uniref:restriction endonuclease subunit S n=1 Tax=Corynebacterium matruchotii TaxID=43768 RepID=UPI0028E54939|nr:restriction endonuclease subunit S [Corynebacterium matruchotii]